MVPRWPTRLRVVLVCEVFVCDVLVLVDSRTIVTTGVTTGFGVLTRSWVSPNSSRCLPVACLFCLTSKRHNLDFGVASPENGRCLAGFADSISEGIGGPPGQHLPDSQPK